MKERGLYLDKAQPAAFKALKDFQATVSDAWRAAGLDPILVELVRIRISQINGCAYCLDSHSRAALELGEDQRRLSMLPAWRECDWFTPEETTALALAETVAIPTEANQRWEVEAEARAVFGDQAFSALCMVAISIDANNRLSIISRHRVPGRPRPE